MTESLASPKFLEDRSGEGAGELAATVETMT